METPIKSSLYFAILLSASMLACEPKSSTKPHENAISSFLTAGNGINLTTRSSGPWELGVVFNVSTAGKITQLGCKMPDPGSYRVILWDYDSKGILRQKTVEQTAPDVLVLNNVEELALPANKKYVISVNSQSSGVNKKYAVASKSSVADFMPFTKGSVLVHNSCYSSVATPTFPNQTQSIKYELYGLPEFTFIPD